MPWPQFTEGWEYRRACKERRARMANAFRSPVCRHDLRDNCGNVTRWNRGQRPTCLASSQFFRLPSTRNSAVGRAELVSMMNQALRERFQVLQSGGRAIVAGCAAPSNHLVAAIVIASVRPVCLGDRSTAEETVWQPSHAIGRLAYSSIVH